MAFVEGRKGAKSGACEEKQVSEGKSLSFPYVNSGHHSHAELIRFCLPRLPFPSKPQKNKEILPSVKGFDTFPAEVSLRKLGAEGERRKPCVCDWQGCGQRPEGRGGGRKSGRWSAPAPHLVPRGDFILARRLFRTDVQSCRQHAGDLRRRDVPGSIKVTWLGFAAERAPTCNQGVVGRWGYHVHALPFRPRIDCQFSELVSRHG